MNGTSSSESIVALNTESESPKCSPLQRMRNRSGQVVIEYVLLMVILASIGAVIMRTLASRNPDEPGLLVAKWNRLLETVAKDNPED